MGEATAVALKKLGSHLAKFLLVVLLVFLICNGWDRGWSQGPSPPTGDPDCALATPTTLPSGTNPVAILTMELDRRLGPDLVVLNSGPSDCLLNAIRKNIDSLQSALGKDPGLDPALRTKEMDQLDKLRSELAGVGTVSTLYGMKDGRFWEVAETQLYTEEGAFKVTAQGTLRVEEAFPGVEPSAIVEINGGNGCGEVLVANNRSPFIFSLSGIKLENISVVTCDGARGCVQGDPSMATGDFDGDGVPDLVLTNTSSFKASLYRGTGKCGFSLLHEWNVGGAGDEPRFVTVGDVNNDGRNDLVVANGGILSRTIRVIVGNGDGTFQLPREFGATERPRSAVIGDFDSDGRPDLIVAGSSSLVFLKGDGKGGFAGKVSVGNLSVPTGKDVPLALVTADFNNDRKLDIAVSNYGTGESGSVDILLGKGDGTFSLVPIRMGSGSHPAHVDTVDLDGDLDVDLVAVAQGTNEVVVLLNLGDGLFVRQPRPRLGWGVTSILTGKFNINTVGDPKVSDLVTARVALEPSGALITMPYGSDILGGTVVAKLIQKITKDFEELKRSQNPDTKQLDDEVGEIRFFYSEKDGSFSASTKNDKLEANIKDKFYPTSMISGNFDETSKQDELVAAFFGSNAAIFFGSNVASSCSHKDEPKCEELPIAGEIPAIKQAGPRTVTAGRLGGTESSLDLALGNFALRNIYVFPGKGDGKFDYVDANGQPNSCLTGQGLNAQPIAMARADFDKDPDSDDDLAVVNYGTSEVVIFLNTGGASQEGACAGRFRLTSRIPVGKLPTSIAAADFTGDGNIDLAVTNSASDTISILVNDGKGNFTTTPETPEIEDATFDAQGNKLGQGKGPVSIATADFTGDGKQDLAVANFLSNDVLLLCGDGTGKFPSRAFITQGYSLKGKGDRKPIQGGPVALAVGFFDDSEKTADLAVGVEFPTERLEDTGQSKIWQSVFILYGPLSCSSQ